MSQYKKSGKPRQVTKYEIKFMEKSGRSGFYFKSFSNKRLAEKEVRKLESDIPNTKWTIKKTKRNVWVKK